MFSKRILRWMLARMRWKGPSVEAEREGRELVSKEGTVLPKRTSIVTWLRAAFSLAFSTLLSSISTAMTCWAPCFLAKIAKTPVPVPWSRTFLPVKSVESKVLISSEVVSWCPAPKAQCGMILTPSGSS